jgi:hypothetical protein
MKVFEIVSEQQQVDEFLGAIPGVARAADATKKAFQGFKRGKDLKAAQAARKARTAKNIFGQGKFSLKGLKGQERLDMVAKRIQVGNAAARGKQVVESGFSGKLLNLISALGVAYYIYEYWTSVTALEDDLAEYVEALKSGADVSEENQLRGCASEEEARELAIETREQLLGKATAAILLSVGFFGKFVANFGKLVQFFGFRFTGSAITGLGNLVNAVGRVGGAAFLTWIETTESGKAFMKHWATLLVLGGIGNVTSRVINGIIGAIDSAEEWLEKKTGLDVPGVPDAARSKIEPSSAEKDAAYAANQAKQKEINGVTITDKDGYLRTDPDLYSNLKIINAVGRALRGGQPNPLDVAPRKPGVTYPEFKLDSNRFS